MLKNSNENSVNEEEKTTYRDNEPRKLIMIVIMITEYVQKLSILFRTQRASKLKNAIIITFFFY